ncbi:flagellar biosynthetic protein FliR [Calidifontibacillus erzurumensis]|uniref:Flagellar biosynthetic protein FliR n=1 Tax=Calidifontibacillus erzurumensis TaxID=2741433 RepID=A0A8J8GC96_9BACI|nr:flagellar biosynthetic protein FliR [Calidifontibacillus erzurumensis]NSL51169.1 flagellar type III secretion system protein FliR [Calidifontibacillus erzurumensis]
MIEIINAWPVFLLIFIRVTSFFVTVPLFSYRNIPAVHKVGFSFFLSYIMFFTIEHPIIEIDEKFFLLLLKEILVGLLLGLIAFMVMSAVQIAGGFIDFQMGFAIANVIDPQTGAQSPIMGQYLYTFAMLLMLSIDAHHLLLDGIFYSYKFIPLNELSISLGSEKLAALIAKTFGTMFIIAFQMSIPIVGCLFLVDLALGITARTVPQLNIFVVGLPVKILASFFILLAVLPAFMFLFEKLFESMILSMRSLLQIFGGL